MSRVPSSRLRVSARRVARVIGWTTAAGMSVVAVIRLLRSDSQPQLIGLQGVGMWLLLPAYPLAIAAALTRQRSLAVVAAVLAAGNVVWVAESYEVGHNRSAPPGTATIRLVTANLLLTNTEVEELAGDLAATDADIILLQEVTPEHLADIRFVGLLQQYPYHVLDARAGFHGSAILSKLPVAGGAAFLLAGSPMTRADITTSVGAVTVINVHTVAPINESQARRWRGQFDLLAQQNGETDGPLIMAGDYNATKDHSPMDGVLASGMRDAYSDAGTGVGATWPQWGSPMVPVMRLDHVLVNDQVTVLNARLEPNRGSDHLRLAVELAVAQGFTAAPS
jgi:endonuclease/exonuclease/phosphatase (EEP) superfamily protein YafD